jgi:hypothetical protein
MGIVTRAPGLTGSVHRVATQLDPQGSPARFADAALSLVRPGVTNGVRARPFPPNAAGPPPMTVAGQLLDEVPQARRRFRSTYCMIPPLR